VRGVIRPGLLAIHYQLFHHMSTIRKQSIISSVIIYLGFAVGLVNTYFFTKQGLFTEAQYGLTSVFVLISTLMMSFAALGMPTYIFKFYPYYHDHLPSRKNDMLTWALLFGTIGFILVMTGGLALKHLIIRKFSENSALLVYYYYWVFAMGFGLTIYTILETYAWNFNKSVLTNFLREFQWRLFTTILIVLLSLGIIRDFDLFIKLYAFTYPAIALILFIYLVATRRVHFTFRVSKVTRRYFRKIVLLCVFVYSSLVILTLYQVFDAIVIASVLKDGLSQAGIFALAKLMGSVIQAPQRGVITTSFPHLSRAWKEKNMGLIQRVYHRSSINLLIFACGLYALIALNYREAILAFHLKESYLLGFHAFLIIGLTCVIDMGTGLNSQIISTSTYWKFELVSGVILLVFMLPLSYILAKQLGIVGPPLANLVSITMYNLIRLVFLWKKFRLFPFSMQSLYTLLLAGACFGMSYFLLGGIQGIPGLIVRSIVFLGCYFAGAAWWKLSPDIHPVLNTIRKRLGLSKA
jgi:O-antigen/teichoic acid export membrane protein